MNNWIEKIKESSQYIKSITGAIPDVAMVVGSGLGSLTDIIEDAIIIDYDKIPGFLRSTVQGHEGKLVYGCLFGRKVLAMKGRYHYYEGYEMENVVFPIRVFKMLGINDLLLTNAAGGVNKSFIPGDLMLITDHLGFALPSPLRGANIDELGVRFPDMSTCYSRKLIDHAKKCAEDLDIDIKTGIYSYSQGPMFETPAEINALRILGADAVGMSTVPEAIAANHMLMNVMAISCITNMAAGILDQPLTHSEVMETGKMVEEKFSRYVGSMIKGWSL